MGLVPKRTGRGLEAFLTEYIAGRTDLKESTRTNLKIGADRMVAFFGANRDLLSITAGDCDDWVCKLKEEYAGATVAKTVKWAKQFFRAARRRRLIVENPFDEIKPAGMANKAREFFVDREITRQVLDACPDAEWRLLFALSRFGGLRCPSEHLELTWDDVKPDRFWVRSPKTEHHEGREGRWVPIFPELREYLEDVRELAPPGTVHVITRYRDRNQNLRTQLKRIIQRAGLKPWPRLFHNLRASRETELAAAHPIHVVCAWMGNTERIAAKHYLQITEADFERTAGLPGASSITDTAGINSAKNDVAQSGSERMEAQEEPEFCENSNVLRVGALDADCRNSLQDKGMTPRGFEPLSQP